jgi:hypothetical protein
MEEGIPTSPPDRLTWGVRVDPYFAMEAAYNAARDFSAMANPFVSLYLIPSFPGNAGKT